MIQDIKDDPNIERGLVAVGEHGTVKFQVYLTRTEGDTVKVEMVVAHDSASNRSALFDSKAGLKYKDSNYDANAALRQALVAISGTFPSLNQQILDLQGVTLTGVDHVTIELIRQDQKIRAIKHLRDQRPDLGLKEAKEMVDQIQYNLGLGGPLQGYQRMGLVQ